MFTKRSMDISMMPEKWRMQELSGVNHNQRKQRQDELDQSYMILLLWHTCIAYFYILEATRGTGPAQNIVGKHMVQLSVARF